MLLVETGSLAWRYYSRQAQDILFTQLCSFIKKQAYLMGIRLLHNTYMHIFMLVWCNTLHFSMAYEQGTSFFEKVFTVIFNNEVSSVPGITCHLQSVYNSKLDGRPSLVRLHDCKQRGMWCEASASGPNTKDKSTGKWKLAGDNSWAKHYLQHKRIWLALRDSHTLLHCIYCTQYVTIWPLARFEWRILLTFLIDIQT